MSHLPINLCGIPSRSNLCCQGLQHGALGWLCRRHQSNHGWTHVGLLGASQDLWLACHQGACHMGPPRWTMQRAQLHLHGTPWKSYQRGILLQLHNRWMALLHRHCSCARTCSTQMPCSNTTNSLQQHYKQPTAALLPNSLQQHYKQLTCTNTHLATTTARRKSLPDRAVVALITLLLICSFLCCLMPPLQLGPPTKWRWIKSASSASKPYCVLNWWIVGRAWRNLTKVLEALSGWLSSHAEWYAKYLQRTGD